MTNSNKPQSQQPISSLLEDNPLLLIEDLTPLFRLDPQSLAALQQIRNEIAMQKLNFQVDLDDPQYSLKTLRLLAYLDAKLDFAAELIALHVSNTTHVQE